MLPAPSDLAYFEEIARTLNISRAAERLGIAQPSLSLAVRRLEESVGTALLIRSKKGVSLTRAGRQLLVRSRELRESWETMKAEALASVEDVQGVYTLGCHQSVALPVLSKFLPDLMKKYPRLDIQLRHDISRRIAEDVISGQVDIGIVVNPVRHPDLVITSLCQDEFTLWSAGKGNETILICDPELAQSQHLMKQLKKSGFAFERIMTSPSLEVIADLTAHGGGIGLLPGRVAAMTGKKLKRVPRAPVFHDEHCLLYRVENKGVKSIHILREAIKDCFETIAPGA